MLQLLEEASKLHKKMIIPILLQRNEVWVAVAGEEEKKKKNNSVCRNEMNISRGTYKNGW
jgi:hypothetical protein